MTLTHGDLDAVPPGGWPLFVTRRLLDYRARKGFCAVTMATCAERVLALGREIHELTIAIHEGMRSSSVTHAMRMEMADVANYALTLHWDLFGETMLIDAPYHGGPRKSGEPATLTSALRADHATIVQGLQCGDQGLVQAGLARLLASLLDLRTRVLAAPGTLAVDCLRKIDLMADRPPMHGKKSPRW